MPTLTTSGLDIFVTSESDAQDTHVVLLSDESVGADKEAFDHYKRYIKALNDRGIEPFLNIWHWTVPVWFAEEGGFLKRANIKYFERLVLKVADELLGGVNFVITLNEPNVYIGIS